MLTVVSWQFPRLLPLPVASILVGGELSHADPVVPILVASIYITLGAALGGLLMKWLKQPAVLGELLVGLLAGNLGYYFGSPPITVLREGDNLSRISSLALTGPYSISEATYKVLPPGPQAELIANLLASAQGRSYISVYSFIDVISRIAILVLLFLVGLTLTVVAIIGKVAAGWACPPTLNRPAVGFGMMPRGEVGLIFAGIGKGIGVVDEGLFSAVILLVMVTTVLAPILLRATLGVPESLKSSVARP